MGFGTEGGMPFQLEAGEAPKRFLMLGKRKKYWQDYWNFICALSGEGNVISCPFCLLGSVGEGSCFLNFIDKVKQAGSAGKRHEDLSPAWKAESCLIIIMII